MVSNIAHGGTLAFTHSGKTALDYNNNGVIIAADGIGELGGKITSSSGTGEVIIGTGGTIQFDSTVANNTINFDDGTGELIIEQLGNIASSVRIDGLLAGDTIEIGSLPTGFIENYSSTTHVLTITDALGAGLGSLTFGGNPLPDANTVLNAVAPICFLAGTHIQTDHAEVPVDELAVGQMVMTLQGQLRPIVWIGSGRVLATRGVRNAATPVIVRKGALAPNVPHQDLRVTKGHSLFLDDVLIPVEFLVNHRSILWDDRAQEVAIYHIELDTHDILLANGAATESYRDDGNRWLFQNGNGGWGLPAKAPCAPVLTGGPIVDAVWRRLLDLAGPRPSVPLTQDPDLHLRVNGVRVDAVTRTDNVFVFMLRDTPDDGVCVVSRAGVPQELGIARDPRCLGVAVQRVVVRQGTRFRLLKSGDALLTEGFYPFEVDSGLEWTDGNAVLPAGLFAGFAGSIEVVIQIGATTYYVDDGDVRHVA